jgi:hypothetical protein
MERFSTIPVALILALAMASGAAAQDTSSTTTTGTVEIQERAGIEAAGEVMFQDIQFTPNVGFDPQIATSETSANVTVTGDSAVVSMAVPETIDVTLAGGEESLTVFTSTDGDQATVSGLESLISAGGVLSVDVGGAITVSAADLAPGEYRGLLVVVAQYN